MSKQIRGNEYDDNDNITGAQALIQIRFPDIWPLMEKWSLIPKLFVSSLLTDTFTERGLCMKCSLNQNILTLTEDNTKITVACSLHYTIQNTYSSWRLKDSKIHMWFVLTVTHTQLKGKHTLNYSRILPSNYFGKQEKSTFYLNHQH